MESMKYQTGLELSKEMNANGNTPYPATPYASDQSFYDARPVTRASKRARTEQELPMLTPESISSTPPCFSPAEGFSSPLSSPPDSPLLLPTPVERESLLVVLKYPPGDPRFDCEIIMEARTPLEIKHTNTKLRAARTNGVLDFTITAANVRSEPPPGPELLVLVEEAKLHQGMPKLYDSSVLRLVDDKWCAPQICSSCRDRGKACNRATPCTACVVAAIPCYKDQHMCLVRFNRISSVNVSPETISDVDVSFLDGPMTHSPVIQNLDGSWSTGPVGSLSLKSRRRARPTRNLETIQVHRGISPNVSLAGMDEETNSIDEQPTAHRSRKRTLGDAGFIPEEDSFDPDSVLDLSEPPPQQVARRRQPRSAITKRLAVNKSMEKVQQNKPEPYGKPHAWADKRQQLCEVLPYYKAYQSAAYTSGGLVHSFMCDKEVGIRDKFDDQILIARVGGGKTLDEEGNMVQGKDQDKSRLAVSFMRTQELKKPIVLIAGEGNSICPTKLPHYYNVMDWFHVTDVWCELLNGFKTWMVRLEKINLLERSWWSPKDAPYRLLEASEAEFININNKQCQLCDTSSHEIFKAGWTCLNTVCEGFFKFENGYDERTLDYNDGFLKKRTEYIGPDPGPLIPPLPTKEQNVTYLCGIERVCREGVVCPQCGCCSRRIEWRHWFCENPHCDFTYTIPQEIISISQAVTENSCGKKKSEFVGDVIRSRLMCMGPYDVTEYIIPGRNGEPIGFVRHFKSTGVINSQPDGPNDLFRQMQEFDFGLRRNAVRHPGKYIEMVTAHFAANWGATYKYGVAQISKGFDQAPPVIIKAVKRLTWAGEQAVAAEYEGFHPFNELLSIGYMEGQHISYHDDGEEELGPTVATLSLGADAIMAFRPKVKSAVEANRKKPSKSATATKPDILRVKLEHGDIIIMHGREIQSLYEHAVDPTGQLRFALTCRYVDPAKMTKESDRAHAKVAGALPPSSEQYNYDGDINAVEIVEPEEEKSEITKVLELIKAKRRIGMIGKATLAELKAEVENMLV